MIANKLKTGTIFQDKFGTYVVLEYVNMKQGRGGSTIKVKVKNIETGAITEKGFHNNDKIADANVSRKSASFLYNDDENIYIMDNTTFETGSFKMKNEFLKSGDKVIVVYLNGNIIDVEIPNIVELKVKYTEDAVSGNTTTSAMKNSTLESGISIMVPLFIKIGDIIKVNTLTKEYTAKA